MSSLMVALNVPAMSKRKRNKTKGAGSGALDPESDEMTKGSRRDNLLRAAASKGSMVTEVASDQAEEEDAMVVVDVAKLVREFILNSKMNVEFVCEIPYFNGKVRWAMFMFVCRGTFGEECVKRLGNLGIGTKENGVGIINCMSVEHSRFSTRPMPLGSKVMQTERRTGGGGAGMIDKSDSSSSTTATISVANLFTTDSKASANGQGTDGPVDASRGASSSSFETDAVSLAEAAAEIAAAKNRGEDPAKLDLPGLEGGTSGDGGESRADSLQSGGKPIVAVPPVLAGEKADQTEDEDVDLHMTPSQQEEEEDLMFAHESDEDDDDAAEANVDVEKGKSQFLFEGMRDRFRDTIKSRIAVDSVIDLVNTAAQPSFDYIMLVFVASILACIGLVVNNVVVIVASMLVSPLMGPILAVTFGATMRDQVMIKLGLFSELTGLFICVVVGFVGGLCAAPFVGDEWPTPEMWSRASAQAVAVGVAIAVPSGVGVALSVLGNNTSSLVGVAISASLLPPAVNTGILLAMGALARTDHMDFGTATESYPDQPVTQKSVLRGAGWSLLLTLANILCIWIAGILMFKLKEVTPIEGKSDFWTTHVPNTRAYNTVIKKKGPEADKFRETLQKALRGEDKDFDAATLNGRVPAQNFLTVNRGRNPDRKTGAEALKSIFEHDGALDDHHEPSDTHTNRSIFSSPLRFRKSTRDLHKQGSRASNGSVSSHSSIKRGHVRSRSREESGFSSHNASPVVSTSASVGAASPEGVQGVAGRLDVPVVGGHRDNSGADAARSRRRVDTMASLLVTVHVPVLLKRKAKVVAAAATSGGVGESGGGLAAAALSSRPEELQSSKATAQLATTSTPPAAVAATEGTETPKVAQYEGIPDDEEPHVISKGKDGTVLIDIARRCREFIAEHQDNIDFISETIFLNGQVRWATFTFIVQASYVEICVKQLASIGIARKKNGVGLLSVVPLHSFKFSSHPGLAPVISNGKASSQLTRGLAFKSSLTNAVFPASVGPVVEEPKVSFAVDPEDPECDFAHEAEFESSDDDEPKAADGNGEGMVEMAGRFRQTIKSRVAVDSVIELVNAGAEFSFDYACLVGIASILACIGLVINNSIVIVASMLVSPLMGPILAVTFGATMRDRKMIKLGLFSELVGLAICVLVGLIGGFSAAPFVGKYWPTSAMWSRADARDVYIGVAIAIPSGFGVALSVLGNNTSSLVGVAISASLLPPAVNTGILCAMAILAKTGYLTLSLDDSQVSSPFNRGYPETAGEVLNAAGWSLLITVANIVCIWMSGILMFKIKEVSPIEDKSDFWTKHVPNIRRYNTVLMKKGTQAKDLKRALRAAMRVPREGASTAFGTSADRMTRFFTLDAFRTKAKRDPDEDDEKGFNQPQEQNWESSGTMHLSSASLNQRRTASDERLASQV
ncbi:Uncharacterized protein MJ0678 [Durusdinium trenchii]|uniref:Uncharacterized protein MJ0678 n=1 Tax=Durusdinium trenchii TaxID=1381693 RepID=A0ABP0IT55_9DINO